MSESLFDEELEEVFRLLILLEDQLLQISLPYLEAGENRILDDADFLEDIKKIAASSDWAMSGNAPQAAMEVWNAVGQRVPALTVQTQATDVLLLAVAVMFVRHTLANIERPGRPITVNHSRSHPDFYSKIEEACHVAGAPRLFEISDDSQLRLLAAALRLGVPEISEASVPVLTGESQRA